MDYLAIIIPFVVAFCCGIAIGNELNRWISNKPKKERKPSYMAIGMEDINK